ncbi:MAG: pirin family protein [Candidatus Tectomicrobia bacterium]|uniref:Pirin family protein n=1 Tax=Tectimicrobiota bacterium TaxID=2528274 RepID=A0A932CLZ2_UNCTE|nr:pirin family protein [Candidatus Tectomicrobia bacterium]
MIVVRNPDQIYQTQGQLQNGTFDGRWHFSFDRYYDPEYTHFGTLRVFNDNTFSPGAVWPLHPHRDIELVTYCVAGEFCHEDERGIGGVLKPGWAQHTTTGRGMWHAKINHRPDIPLRFIQIWFFPWARDLEPFAEQKAVERAERTNRFLPLVSNAYPDALDIASDAQVYSCFLQKGKKASYMPQAGRGVYLYLIEGGPVRVSGYLLPTLGAARITEESSLHVAAKQNAELLLVDVLAS